MTTNIYVIGRTYDIQGLGAIMSCVASHILYAFDNNYVPVIDMKHYYNQYFKDGRVYKDNVWEYFFEQPSDFCLTNIDENANNFIICKNAFFSNKKYALTCNELPKNTFCAKTDNINKLKERYKECYKFNNETMQFIEKQYDEIIKGENDILGVLVRGTDYSIRKTKGEQIQPKPAAVIKKVKLFLKKHSDIKKIYIATEDDSIYQMFKKEFGEMLIDNNQYRYTYDKNNKPYLAEIVTTRQNHNYQLAREYLSSLYILSKCKYFIGGRCAGTKIAWILSDGWDDVYIWDLGIYGKNKFLTNIFECINKKDENDIKYKSLTILGMKFKIYPQKYK